MSEIGNELGKQYTLTLDDDPLMHSIISTLTEIPSLHFSKAEQLLPKARKYSPIAAFIDVHLGPDECGLDVLPELRQIWPDVPLLVLTSDERSDLVGEALAAGANDFVRKPLSPSEFLGRLHARITEMKVRQSSRELAISDVFFDTRLRSLRKEERITYLPFLEGELFTVLANSFGLVVKKSILQRQLWGSTKISGNAFDKKVSNLRKALREIQSNLIVTTIYGGGVKLERDSDRSGSPKNTEM